MNFAVVFSIEVDLFPLSTSQLIRKYKRNFAKRKGYLDKILFKILFSHKP